MEKATMKRMPSAIALGAFFACVTGYVLFKDVIDGAPVTTNHALSLAALVAAIASFHMIGRTGFRSGAALFLIGIAATAYVVISSGARNAETAQAKARNAIATNEERERVIASQEQAKSALDAARTAKAKECATGRGPLCRAAVDTLAMAEVAEREAAAVPVPVAVQVNGGYVHAAKVIAALPFVTATDSSIEERLELLMPFLVALIVELGTVAFIHVGLGHIVEAPVSQPVPSVPKVEPANDDSFEGGPDGGTRAQGGEIVSWVREFRARNGRNPQIPELQREFQVPKTTAWRRIKGA